MLKRSLHSRILVLIVGLISIGVIISIYWELKHKEEELLDEKLRASRFMAQPILNAIYEDMLEERADMARHLINSLSKGEGIESLYIVRSNGTEEAFKDLKTINEVKKEFGEVKPEWLTDHADVKENIAKGVNTAEFKSAFKSFKENWARGEIYYIDKTDHENPVFIYLHPIEKKAKCNTCHATEGARGILVIRTSLVDMYGILAKGRNQWIISGVLAISIGGVLLSLLIKKSITGPIQKNVEVIKRIAEGRGDISERVEVTAENEVGYLASAFNNMLDTLGKRADENKKLFELVTKSKEEWVATFDAIQDLISIHDKDYRILKINKALARKFNAQPEELIGTRCYELLYNCGEPKCDCPHSRTLKTGNIADAEVDDLVFEGIFKVTTFPVYNDAGEVWASVHVARDITQEKMLREQLLHAEKLSSVGKLVAGIAHELNNPLMGIMGFSQILMDTPGDKKLDDIKDKLRKIYHESLRTAKIVQNLLTFARAKKTEREYHNINEILKHTVELREYSLKANNIQVTMQFDETLPKTMVDLFQLQQVFINIMNNAEDAMVARKGKGKLEIKTRKNRRKIEISFKDDGPGISKEIIHKVFDPFFTTKDVGKGTGLGLSITHGIITEHGGSIDIMSPDEGGAIVTIELPIVEKEQWAEVKKAVDTGAAVSHGNALSGKKVLIVDDEKSIREALYSILSREGFKVDTARDGREALEILERNKMTLLITDIKMPGYSGMDLYESVMQKHAYLKDRIIIVTGDVFSQDVKEFLTKSGCPYILKPFEPKKLTDLIQTVLAEDITSA
ncbi:MAG: response regulator [Deltaproteobacteria bacterium]|nr:response regulator [Deltaproteobacteria bacterium]